MNNCFEFVGNILTTNEIAFELHSEAISGFKVIVCLNHTFCLRLISIKQYISANLEPSFFFDNKTFKGQRVINLWEDECLNKPQIVSSRLRALIGINKKIPGRLCIVKRIDQKVSELFLNQNHLQGSTKAKIKLGLILKPQYNERFGFEDNTEILLGVATFANCRNIQIGDSKQKSAELIRIATALNINVIGGFDKLISNYEKMVLPDDMVTYIDNDWSSGGGFLRIGFVMEKQIEAIAFNINLESFERKSIKKSNLMEQDESFSSEVYQKIYNAGSIKLRRNFRN